MSSANDDVLYISPKLAKAIAEITVKPLTLITAGSGYGKTTATVNCLKCVPRSTIYHWYTCFGEVPGRAWEGVCHLISYADERVGEYLSKLDTPSLDHLGQISALMGEISCDKEMILIIDNFQLAGFPAPHRLINALSMHSCPHLHIVVLTQPLYIDSPTTIDPRVHRIGQDAFCFTPPDVRLFFGLGGADISEEQAERLCSATEGWAAALRLHLISFLADGKFSEGAGMGELMELSFWQRLDERQKELFLGLSVLPRFTEAQAARMLGRDVIPTELWASVRGNAFVRKTGKEYMLHSLLKSFLSSKLLAKPKAFCQRIYGRAGVACLFQGENVDAFLFFADAGEDVNAVFVPLNSMQLAELVRTKADRLEALLSHCRVEILEGKETFLLGIAVKASLNGKTSLAQTAVSCLDRLQMINGNNPQRWQTAAAAKELAASFRAYNDIAEMSRHHIVAIELLENPRDFYVTNDSWTFCVPSVAYMFWRESGALEECSKLLRQGIPGFALLSAGKGLGAPEAMDAERCLLAGNVDEGATLAYLARTIAQTEGQDSVLFCVHTLLGRAALLRGDGRAFGAALRELRRCGYECQEFYCVVSAEMALGFLYSIMDMEDEIPEWLLSAESVRQALYPISVPFALIIVLRHIGRQSPDELIGTAEAFIHEADAAHHLLPKIYFLLEQAVWYERSGKRDKAVEKAAQAMFLAAPDQVLLPFAEYYGELSEVLNCEPLKKAAGVCFEDVHRLGRAFLAGAAAVRASLSGTSPLTQREREIARLAQQRASTKAIAEALGISPATVKNTLNKVYSKLNISGKAELENCQL